MVFVQGGEHLLDQTEENEFHTLAYRQELGLTSDAIRVSPTFYHRDINTDSFGPNVPAEVMWNLAECTIHMNLVHYDSNVLAGCIQEAGAGGAGVVSPAGEMGQMRPASALMGNGLPLLASGNHFIKLSIDCPIDDIPWIFPATYLARQPFIYPLGTGVSIVQLSWRAIPYVPLLQGTLLPYPEIRSEGARLWHHEVD